MSAELQTFSARQSSGLQLVFLVLAESLSSGARRRQGRAESAEVEQREPDAAALEGGPVAHEAGGAADGVDGRTLREVGVVLEGRRAEGGLRQEQADQAHSQIVDVGKAS